MLDNEPVIIDIGQAVSIKHPRAEEFLRRDLENVARLAKKNDVAIGFSFNSVLNSSGMLRAQIIGRMQQNISLCRKYKNKTVIASFARNPYEMRAPGDLMAFFVAIGMHQKEAKDGLNLF